MIVLLDRHLPDFKSGVELAELWIIAPTLQYFSFDSALENFKIDLRLPVPVGDEHRNSVEEAVQHCLMHNTLLHPPTITIEVEGVQQTAQVA